MSFVSEIVGSFSTGAEHNPTVAVMEAAFAADGLDWRYLNCEVGPDDLEAAVAGAWAMGWRGFNCSMPHKQTVIRLLSDLSDTARIIQAVNCVERTSLGWVGHNTDGVGFVASLLELAEVTGTDVLVIGSGGAAHAIAIETARAGADRVAIAARNPEASHRLATRIESETASRAATVAWDLPLRLPPTTSVVVNATPVGMLPRPELAIELDWSSLRTDAIVADVVPNPASTTLLRLAAAAGATTIDGRSMLVNQAAENHRIWS